MRRRPAMTYGRDLGREGACVAELSGDRRCVSRQGSYLEAVSPFRLRRGHAEVLAGTEPEAAVVPGIAEQDDQGDTLRVSGAEERVHQGAPDACALMVREDPDRPHGHNRFGGDGRPARRDMADYPAAGERCE